MARNTAQFSGRAPMTFFAEPAPSKKARQMSVLRIKEHTDVAR